MGRNTSRSGLPSGVIGLYLLTAGLCTWLLAGAQQTDPNYSGSIFTGISTSLDTDGVRLTRRYFEAGAYSGWHRHSGGQLLLVESGRARMAERGGPLRELGPGESVFTGPNVEHWHGATPESELYQVAVSYGAPTEWLAPATEAEYEGR